MRVKGLAANVSILILSILLVFLGTEVVLRFTPYKQFIDNSFLNNKSLIVTDGESKTALSKNHPKTLFKMNENPHEVWTNGLGCFDEPYHGEKDFILLVGDSFTYGIAPLPRTFGAVIEKTLGRRVLKCGVPGYGPAQELLQIKRVVRQTGPPALIIVGYFVGNDLQDDIEFREFQKRKSGPGSGGKAGFIATIGQAGTRVKSWFIMNSIVFNLARSLSFVHRIKSMFGSFSASEVAFTSKDGDPVLEGLWEMHLGNLVKISEEAAACGSKLLVVIIPNKRQVYNFLWAGGANRNYPNRIVADFLEQRHIEHVDLLPPFLARADQTERLTLESSKDFFWKYDGHFSLAGHQLAGEIISRYLVDHPELLTAVSR